MDNLLIVQITAEAADGSAGAARTDMVRASSGSGKSSLLNLIGGLDRATSGTIRVDGHSLSELSDSELTRVRRDKIGFIFQFFNLLPTLSCLENVSLPLHLRGISDDRTMSPHLD